MEDTEETKDAYYSKEMDVSSGASIYLSEDGHEVRTNLVVPVGRAPNTGFTDVTYIGRVTRHVRNERFVEGAPLMQSAEPARMHRPNVTTLEGAPRDLKALCGLGRFNLMRLGKALGYERDAFGSCNNEEAARLVFLKLWEADGKTEWPWFGEFSRADFDWMLEQCRAKSKGTLNLYVFEYTKTTNGGKLLVCMDVRGNGYYMRALDVRARDASKAIFANTWASTVATAMNALRLYPSNYESWVAEHAKKEEAKPSEPCGSCDGRGCPTCNGGGDGTKSSIQRDLEAGLLTCCCHQRATVLVHSVIEREGKPSIDYYKAKCVYCADREKASDAGVAFATAAVQTLGGSSLNIRRRVYLPPKSANRRELAKPHPWELDEDKVI